MKSHFFFFFLIDNTFVYKREIPTRIQIPARVCVCVCASTTLDETLQKKAFPGSQDCCDKVAKINLFPFPSKSWVIKPLLSSVARGSAAQGPRLARRPQGFGILWLEGPGGSRRQRAAKEEREVECGESSLLPPGALGVLWAMGRWMWLRAGSAGVRAWVRPWVQHFMCSCLRDGWTWGLLGTNHLPRAWEKSGFASWWNLILHLAAVSVKNTFQFCLSFPCLQLDAIWCLWKCKYCVILMYLLLLLSSDSDAVLKKVVYLQVQVILF